MNLSNKTTHIVRPEPALNDLPRERRCLRCLSLFQSEGFGERICRQCKGTNAWQNSIPIRRSRPRGRVGPGSN